MQRMIPAAPYRLFSLLVAASLVLGAASSALGVLCALHSAAESPMEMPCHASASDVRGPVVTTVVTAAADAALVHGCCAEALGAEAVPAGQEVRCCVNASANTPPALALAPASPFVPLLSRSGNAVHAPPPAGAAAGAAVQDASAERPVPNRQAVLATFLI